VFSTSFKRDKDLKAAPHDAAVVVHYWANSEVSVEAVKQKG
jgi:hypothetical protein